MLLETNTAGNLQLVVQVAKEYTEQLGAGKIMELLEAHKSYHGLYYYLGGHIAFSEDPEVRCSIPVAWCLFPGRPVDTLRALYGAPASQPGLVTAQCSPLHVLDA